MVSSLFFYCNHSGNMNAIPWNNVSRGRFHCLLIGNYVDYITACIHGDITVIIFNDVIQCVFC